MIPSPPPPDSEPRYVVVPRSRHRWQKPALWFGGAALAGVLAGILVGYPLGYRQVNADLATLKQLKESQQQSSEQLESLRNELAVHKHGSEVERQVSERLRQEIVDLQSRLHEHENTITFFKGILDPAKNQGLAVHSFSVARTPVTGRFAFKLVLVQPLNGATEISGTAILTVSGVESGKPKRLDWKSVAGGKPALSFKFKVYQDITGELQLPEAFAPEKIEVRLDSAGTRSDTVAEFPWTLKEAP